MNKCLRDKQDEPAGCCEAVLDILPCLTHEYTVVNTLMSTLQTLPGDPTLSGPIDTI